MVWVWVRLLSGSPDEDGGAFHEFIPQVFPEFFGRFLFAVDSFHEEGRVVRPRILVCIRLELQAPAQPQDRMQGAPRDREAVRKHTEVNRENPEAGPTAHD